MPTPSGRRSSWRTGGGLTISKALKSIKPSSRDCHAIGAAITVISWPATSSITTNCGSLRLLALATCVAAGIPIRTAAKANRAGVQGCQPGAIQRPRSHHRRAVAAERDLRVLAGHGLLADGALQLKITLASHLASYTIRATRS